MKPELIREIDSVCNEIMNQLERVYVGQTPEQIVNLIRQPFKASESAAAYKVVAMGLDDFRAEIAPLDPAEIYSLFDLLVDAQKRREMLSKKSNRSGRSILSKLKMIIGDRYVPQLLQLSRTPHTTSGRPPEMPGYDKCREICEYIVERTKKRTVPMLRAQEEASHKWRLSLRMVQRIWERRDEYLADD